MKMLFTLILIFSTSLCLDAQVAERVHPLSLGNQVAFTMDHEGANKKTVQKYLEKAIKEYGKVKRNKKAKEWNCLQCNVPGISGPANVYFKVEEGKGMATSYVFFDDGTQFVSSENSGELAAEISKSLQQVSYDITRHVIGEELDGEEDSLKDRNKELGKLEKKNKELHEEIEKCKKKISEAEAGIEKNLQQQEDKQMEIEKQKSVVEEVTTRLNAVGKN